MDCEIELTNKDTGTTLFVPSITTITYFKGALNFSYITNKIYEIIEVNPWLTSNIIKRNDNYYINYNDKLKNFCIDDYLFYTQEYIFENIINVEEYEKIMISTNKFFVKSAHKCVNNKEKLFRVTILDNKNIYEPKFALIVSLSHVLGDGHTYYKLYNMISENSIIEKMIIHRYKEFDNITIENKYSWYSYLGVKLYKFISSFKKNKKIFKLYILDDKELEIPKNKYKSNSNNISKNDIITSNFFNSANCKIGLMAINFRNIIESLNNLNAGNYVDTIKYNLNKKITPLLVREKLEHLKKKNIICRKNFWFNFYLLLLDFCNFFNFFNMSIATISSWTTFNKNIEFRDCQETLHIPCLSNLNSNIYLSNFAVVFKISKNQTGVLSNVEYCKYD